MKSPRLTAFRLGLAIVALALLLAPSTALAQLTPEAAKVRVLLVLDTDDEMGATWGLDGENMKALIEHMVQKQGLEGRVVIDHFVGKQVTPKSVLQYYNKLDVGPDDALVFYFSGHGGFLKSKGHVLAFKHGLLFRNDLLTAMDKKKPGLRVVLTDCCANYLDGRNGLAAFGDPRQSSDRRPPVGVNHDIRKSNEPPSEEAPLPPGAKVRDATAKAKREEPRFETARGVAIRTLKGRVDWEALMDKVDGKMLRDLLFRHRGLVDINACKIGELSLGQYDWGGSVGTNAFLLLQADPVAKFDSQKVGQVTWEAFFPHWQRFTDEIARAYTNKQAGQVPYAWQLGQNK